MVLFHCQEFRWRLFGFSETVFWFLNFWKTENVFVTYFRCSQKIVFRKIRDPRTEIRKQQIDVFEFSGKEFRVIYICIYMEMINIIYIYIYHIML